MTKTDQCSPLQAVGSLWLAAVLLLLLMISMGCATVHEMRHGLDAAKEVFYQSWWFITLLTLFCVNAVAALIVRWPFTAKDTGFAMTHVALVVIFVGGWATRLWGVEGQVALTDGQSATHFSVGGDAVVVESDSGGDMRQIVFEPRELADDGLPAADMGDASVSIAQYMPDSRSFTEVVQVPQGGQPAIRLVLSVSGQEMPRWVFAGGAPPNGQSVVSYRVVPDRAALDELIRPAPTTQPASTATVRVTAGEQVFEFPLEECLEGPVPIGDTGHDLRVQRYLPHATVGDSGVENLSDQPKNPAIEFQMTVPGEAPVRGWAFARMPDLDLAAMHGRPAVQDMKVTLVMPGSTLPATSIEIVAVPDGPMYARFLDDAGEVQTTSLTVGESVATPFQGVTMAVSQRLDHAVMKERIEPMEEPSESPAPAVRLTISASDGEESSVWVQKYTSRSLTLGGHVYRLSYADKRLPLDCRIELDKFTIRRYPGIMMPRSYESRVTFYDPATGREQERVISMNHPAKHGRYTFFQSSYREREQGPPVTILSVAHDPGQPVVFAGYFLGMLGMIWVVAARLAARRNPMENGTVAETPQAEEADE